MLTCFAACSPVQRLCRQGHSRPGRTRPGRTRRRLVVAEPAEEEAAPPSAAPPSPCSVPPSDEAAAAHADSPSPSPSQSCPLPRCLFRSAVTASRKRHTVDALGLGLAASILAADAITDSFCTSSTNWKVFSERAGGESRRIGNKRKAGEISRFAAEAPHLQNYV